jgi:hypothetical protein
MSNQSPDSIAIGRYAGTMRQGSSGSSAIAIGTNSGENDQGQYGIAIGYRAGSNSQGGKFGSSIAMGVNAGQENQGPFTVAIGYSAGQQTQGNMGIAIGSMAGVFQQGSGAISLGGAAGQTSQSDNSIALGTLSGSLKQQSQAVAIGFSAGKNTQSANAIAIGANAGLNNQGSHSIAIGTNAGSKNEGTNSIAIGSQAEAPQPYSIVINATTKELSAAKPSSFYVAPIRQSKQNHVLGYNTQTSEITYFNYDGGGGGGSGGDCHEINIGPDSGSQSKKPCLPVWIVGGESVMFHTSEPTVKWTATPISLKKVSQLVYCDSLRMVFAIGQGTTDMNEIRRSVDGINWTPLDDTNKTLMNPEMTVHTLHNTIAANKDGSKIIAVCNNQIVSSVDGINWTKIKFNVARDAVIEQTVDLPSSDAFIRFDPSNTAMFTPFYLISGKNSYNVNYWVCIVKINTSATILYTSDLDPPQNLDITWRKSGVSSGGSICYVPPGSLFQNGGFVGTSYHITQNNTSAGYWCYGVFTTKGLVWTEVKTPTFNVPPIGIHIGASKSTIVMYGSVPHSDTCFMSYTNDNATWTRCTGAAVGFHVNSISVSPHGVWLCTSLQGTMIYSADGKDWSKISNRMVHHTHCSSASFITSAVTNINIGYRTGACNQGVNALSIGGNAGKHNQGSNCVALGSNAGHQNQELGAVSLGSYAGHLGQGDSSIAIGYNAYTYQPQPDHSILISATGSGLSSFPAPYSTVIQPVREATATGWGEPSLLMYNKKTGELGYSGSSTTTTKTFVIDHPFQENKYLVHACLEGPEAGVYYRGKAQITNGTDVTVTLPDYVQYLATNFTVQITPIVSYKYNVNVSLSCSEVENNSFTVYGPNIKFFWHVYGTRNTFEVEPSRDDTVVSGDGPYRWISR